MNTYEKVVEYLKSYQELKYNLVFYRNKMGGLKAIRYSQEEKGASVDNIMYVYMQKIEDTENKMKVIEEFIEENLHGKQRLVVWERYVNNLTLKEIGAMIDVSRSAVTKIINDAINCLCQNYKKV